MAFFFLFAIVITPVCDSLHAGARSTLDPAPILEAAESVYLNMAKADYPALWKGISLKTQRAIVNSVFKALAKEGNPLTETAIAEDFEKGGKIASEYWGGYLSRFDPKIVLEESRWTMGDVAKDKAVIILRYRKSENDAQLMLFFEQGKWKVGLYESFHTRE